jgi:hypothetical protein
LVFGELHEFEFDDMLMIEDQNVYDEFEEVIHECGLAETHGYFIIKAFDYQCVKFIIQHMYLSQFCKTRLFYQGTIKKIQDIFDNLSSQIILDLHIDLSNNVTNDLNDNVRKMFYEIILMSLDLNVTNVFLRTKKNTLQRNLPKEMRKEFVDKFLNLKNIKEFISEQSIKRKKSQKGGWVTLRNFLPDQYETYEMVINNIFLFTKFIKPEKNIINEIIIY